VSGTQGSDRSCVGGGCALAPASVALNGDECVKVPIIAELCTHRLVELGELGAVATEPQHRTLASVWLDGEMSVSKRVRVPIIAELCTHRLSIASSSFWRASRCRNRASALASVTLEADECMCHWVPMLGELCTHRFENLVVLGVAATEPEPLQV